MADRLATMRDRRYVVAEDRDGWGRRRTFGGFATTKQAIKHAESLPIEALRVYDSYDEFDSTIWHKQRYAVLTGRRLFPRKLFESRDLDAAIAFARSARGPAVVMDRNEHRVVLEMPNPESEPNGENG